MVEPDEAARLDVAAHVGVRGEPDALVELALRAASSIARTSRVFAGSSGRDRILRAAQDVRA